MKIKTSFSCGTLIGAVSAAAALLAVQLPAYAAEGAWPNKPVRIIVAFAPGGLTDVVARAFQPSLSETFGQPVIIENKPAAGGTIAEAQLARSEPDGYTLLMTADGVPANPYLYKGLSYDSLQDLQPVSQLVRIPLVMLVNNQVPAESVKELVQYAKSAPGKYSYASPGTGTSNHLFYEVFKDMTGIEMEHVAYKGGSPAMTDLIGGHVSSLLISATLAIPQVQGGKVKAVAVTSSERLSRLPKVPTFAEAGYPDFAPHQWTGLYVPKGTPPEVVRRIHAAFAKAAQEPAVGKRLAELNAEPIVTSPDEFKRFMKSSHQVLGELIKSKSITQ